MSSRSKKKLTVDRTKALRFIAKQEFYKMEEKQEAKGNVLVLERDWYQIATDNESYAQQICTYAVQRHLILLEESIAKMNPKNPAKMQQISMRDHIKQRAQMCINNKIMQFYQCVGLTQPFMPISHPQQPFIVHAPIPMHTMHTMQAMQSMQPRYHYPYAQMRPYQLLINTQPPPAKRMKLSQPKRIEKTKEEIENEKINKLKLPQNLIHSNKLQQWLDEKLQSLKEYESLIVKTMAKNNNKKLQEINQSAITNLRRDIYILKSTVLQQNNQNSNGLSQNKELKRIYLDIIKMDKDLPILRQENIKPFISKYVAQFEQCNIKQALNAQKSIKQILIENKFDKTADEYCNIIGKQFVKDKLFESEINTVLNDDLELLSDFGVKFFVESVKNGNNGQNGEFNLRITFSGHFGRDITEEWQPPNLVVMVNEYNYKHYYGMLPYFEALKQRFIDFIFVVNDNENEDENEDIDLDKCRFTKKHINWLDNYKMNSLKSNGEFVSIVNIYNFYKEAVTALIKEINKSKRKSV